METIGHITIAGAGPGDPGLLTVAAGRAIATADVIVYDALANPALLRGARRGAELIDVGKRAGAHTLPQEQIEALLIREARAGKQVLRLKGGDPFVFGRGGEEAQACARAGVSFTVIPGVTSAIAGPAYAGIPITHRDLSRGFLVITGDERGSETIDWEAAARADTLVILMGASTLAANMDRLCAAGREAATPAACIQWATRSTQRVVVGTVASIAEEATRAGLSAPLITVVGEVVRLSGEIGWFKAGPLAGRSVVVTRATTRARPQWRMALSPRVPGYRRSRSPRPCGLWSWLRFRARPGTCLWAHLSAASQKLTARSNCRFRLIGRLWLFTRS